MASLVLHQYDKNFVLRAVGLIEIIVVKWFLPSRLCYDAPRRNVALVYTTLFGAVFNISEFISLGNNRWISKLVRPLMNSKT